MLALRFKLFWAGIAWLGVALALILSLWPGGVPLPVRLWDKAEHMAGYFILTLWFAGLYPRPRFLQVGLGCFLLGVLIELLQGFVPTRSMELSDLVANLAGIGAALTLAYLLLGGWAARVERAFGLAH
jgi:VanZ family protein